nr:hypothetical protein [Tanacetum cinerariifolium]
MIVGANLLGYVNFDIIMLRKNNGLITVPRTIIVCHRVRVFTVRQVLQRETQIKLTFFSAPSIVVVK